MLRREFLQVAAVAWQAVKPAQEPEKPAIASASIDTTPRVGIVLSSFTGSEDHDGSKIAGLARPRPVTADLTDSELDAQVRKAIELGNTRGGGLPAILSQDDWVVIKTHIPTCHGLGPETKDGGAHSAYTPADVTDPRIVRTLIACMVENKVGGRITIAEGSPEWLPREKSKSPVDGWTTDWGGAFGGLTYRAMVEDFSKRHAGVRFEIVDLNFDETVEVPTHGQPLARQNAKGVYSIPKTIQQCDKVVSIAPLKTHPRMGVALSIANFLGIAPGAVYGFPKAGLEKLGSPDEVAVDLFGYHPADYAILGGQWGLEIDDSGAKRPVHHNLVLAGANARAVDIVGATIMGFDAAGVRHLNLAKQDDFGDFILDEIWLRGNEIEQAAHPFRKPAGWQPDVVK